MRAWSNSLFFALLVIPAWGQVRVDRPLQFTGAETSSRQFHGIPLPSASTDGISADVSRSGALTTVLNVSGNSWVASLPGLGNSVPIGAHVIVRSPATTPGPLSLELNGSGPYPIRRGSEAVDGSDLLFGQAVSMIFDGSAMQMLNGVEDVIRDCPNGMVTVNTQYCIEPDQRPASDFFAAAVSCASAGRRLCSWSEFYAACDRPELGLVGATDAWEWSNNTANEDNSARVVGQGGCAAAGTWPASGNSPLQFRCCYSR